VYKTRNEKEYMPNVVSVSGLSSFCVSCAQCCQRLWIVHSWCSILIFLQLMLTLMNYGSWYSWKIAEVTLNNNHSFAHSFQITKYISLAKENVILVLARAKNKWFEYSFLIICWIIKWYNLGHFCNHLASVLITR
jgi:hypothetical protein